MHKKLAFIFTIFLTSLAYYFSTGFNNIWWLLWIAPIPVLLYALNSSILMSFVAGLTAYFLGNLSYLPYIFSGMPFNYVFLTPALIGSFAFAFILLAFRHLALSRRYYYLAPFIFAGAWTIFEFLRSVVSPDGMLSSLAYTQLTNLPILQVASLVGIWGITFLLTLIPASIALALYYWKNNKTILKIILVPTVLLVFALLFGVYRLSIPESEHKLKIGIVAIDTTNREMFSLKNKDKLNIFRKYATGIATLAQKGADVVLLPEEVMTLTQTDKDIFLQKFATLAKENKIELLVGVRVLSKDQKNYYNSAYLFAANGNLLAHYDKQHPLLVYESSMIPGNSISIINIANKGKWGISICKDNDFINPDKDYGKNKINILFVPAFDFTVDAWLHARPAIMQGVTGNYIVARAAQKGFLSLSDSRGRIIALTPIEPNREQTTLIAEVALP
jgi:apolipoprotein N-acyltransferase